MFYKAYVLNYLIQQNVDEIKFENVYVSKYTMKFQIILRFGFCLSHHAYDTFSYL